MPSKETPHYISASSLSLLPEAEWEVAKSTDAGAIFLKISSERAGPYSRPSQRMPTRHSRGAPIFGIGVYAA